MTFDDNIRYNRLFRQAVHRGGESEINDIKIFQNSRALIILVVNTSFEDHLMHTFLEIFQKGGKYMSQMVSHQESYIGE